MKLTILVLFLGFNTSIASDCVDCIYGLEGFPKVESLAEAACTDCGCYTRTHEETIKSLAPERATLVRKNLSGLIKGNIDSAVFKLAELDKFAKNTANAVAVPECSLGQIKTRISACAGEASPEKLKSLFGHESVDGFLAEIGQKFASIEGGQNASSSCLTSAQQAEMKSMLALKTSTDAFFGEIRNKKDAIKLRLDAGEKFIDIIKDGEFSVLADIVASLSNHPLAMPVLIENDAIKHLITNVDEFSSKQGKGIDFFTKDVYTLFPSAVKTANSTIKETMKVTCAKFVDSVSDIACAGDSIALINDKNIAEKILSYYPDDHKNGYDSMFVMDKSDADPIESSYVDHIYWCAADFCLKNKNAPSCSSLKYNFKVNSAVANVAFESHSFDLFNQSVPTFDTESLCKLASCSGSQDQMNACYEGVREELGEDADSILISFDRATRNFRASSSQGQSADQNSSAPLFTSTPFVRSEFATSFLGEYSGESSTPSRQSVTVTSSTGPDSASNNNRRTVSNHNTSSSNVGVSTTTGTTAPVVTASQAFSQFMDQRFSEIARSPATSTFASQTRRNSTTVASNGASGVERQALRSLNRASETIDELRDSYRQSAFDRMERLFEQAKRQTNTQPSPTVAVNTNTSNSSGFSNSRSSRVTANTNPQGAAPALPGAPVVNNGAGVATDSSQVQQNAVQGGAASSGARSVASTPSQQPRVTTQNGQPTLNVSLGELPRVTEAVVENDGVDTALPFQLAVKVDDKVYMVQVRPAVLSGRKMLEPMLDQLSPTLRAEVLKSPLFQAYRAYLVRELVNGAASGL